MLNEVSGYKYVFQDFVFHLDGSLYYKGKRIHVPPKELEVLTILLESSGEIITKEYILTKVWKDNVASDESLTRCIYSLRRILKENRESRYIDTIYGKGYRFRIHVSVLRPEDEDTRHIIAVLPFKMSHEKYERFLLHSRFIQILSKYSTLGLRVLPASVTYDCNDIDEMEHLFRLMRPDFYLSGRVIRSSYGIKIFVELVLVKGHKLIHNVILECEHFNEVESALNKYIPTLVNNILGMQSRKNIFKNKRSDIYIISNYKNDEKATQPKTFSL